MRAHNTTTSTTESRPRHSVMQLVFALALAVCALAFPAIANAHTGYSSINAITGDSSDSTKPVGASDYSSVNSIVPPASEQGEAQGSASGYSSVNAITGPPADAPTLVSSPPSGSGDGFDWASALVGAGAALALTALGGAALLTVRRRHTVAPSASTS